MCSGSRPILLLAVCGLSLVAADLRVCADPDHLPFSNSRGQGFENAVASLAARDLGRTLAYTWYPQRGRYLKLLRNGVCDVVMGMASESTALPVTTPYYRSSWVFVSRRQRGRVIRSLDDPQLKTARIGIQLLGSDEGTPPAAQALARRGLIHNVTWYRAFRPVVTPEQPEELIDAVAGGQVDLAVLWGPIAGFFTRAAGVPLRVTPIASDPATRMSFDISIGVRPGDSDLLRDLNEFVIRRRTEIRRILQRFGVPLELDRCCGSPR